MPNEVAVDDSVSAPEDRLEELTALLKALADDYDKSRDDDGRRDAATKQVQAITTYLGDIGIPAVDLRPTTALIQKLFDVDRGMRPSFFIKQEKVAASRRVPYDELHQRGLAAAAVTLFMKADEGQDEQKLERALQKVAGRIEKSRAAQNRRAWRNQSRSLREAIKDWRDTAMAGKPEDPDTISYRKMLEAADSYGGPASYWAQWALTDGFKLYR